MKPVKIITDSTVDFPKDISVKYDIEIVPLTITLGDRSFLDYYDVSNNDYYAMLRASTIFPKTAQPSPQLFVEAYRRYAHTHTILSFHISSKLSGTYQSAMLAHSMLPDADIHVIDSKQASLGLGLFTITIAKAIAAGQPLEHLLELTRTLPDRIQTYFCVDSLEHLKCGGRIGKAQALLGTLMKIRPLLKLEDGEIQPLEKVRTTERLLARLQEILADAAKASTSVKCTIVGTDNTAIVDSIRGKATGLPNVAIEYTCQLGGVITSHVGPEAFGLSFFSENTAKQEGI